MIKFTINKYNSKSGFCLYSVVYTNWVENGDVVPFIIDTGASDTTVSSEVLKKLGIKEPQKKQTVSATLADGRVIKVNKFNIPELKVGPFVLQNVPIMSCATCVSLVGQSVLERLDLATKKEGGVEFLELKLRTKQ